MMGRNWTKCNRSCRSTEKVVARDQARTTLRPTGYTWLWTIHRTLGQVHELDVDRCISRIQWTSQTAIGSRSRRHGRDLDYSRTRTAIDESLNLVVEGEKLPAWHCSPMHGSWSWNSWIVNHECALPISSWES